MPNNQDKERKDRKRRQEEDEDGDGGRKKEKAEPTYTYAMRELTLIELEVPEVWAEAVRERNERVRQLLKERSEAMEKEEKKGEKTDAKVNENEEKLVGEDGEAQKKKNDDKKKNDNQKEKNDKKEKKRCEEDKQKDMEKEKAKKERVEKERKKKELLEKERKEEERMEKERKKKDRMEKERKERELLEKERKEKEREEEERMEKERKKKDRMEKERKERERKEMELMEKERKKREERNVEAAKTGGSDVEHETREEVTPENEDLNQNNEQGTNTAARADSTDQPGDEIEQARKIMQYMQPIDEEEEEVVILEDEQDSPSPNQVVHPAPAAPVAPSAPQGSAHTSHVLPANIRDLLQISINMLEAAKIVADQLACIPTTTVPSRLAPPPIQPTLAPQTELRTTFSLLNIRRNADPIDVACRILNTAGITCTISVLRKEGKPQQMPASFPPRSYSHISVPVDVGRKITEKMTELKEVNDGSIEDFASIGPYKTQEELLDDELLQIGRTFLPELDDDVELGTCEINGKMISYRRVGDNSRVVSVSLDTLKNDLRFFNAAKSSLTQWAKQVLKGY